MNDETQEIQPIQAPDARSQEQLDQKLTELKTIDLNRAIVSFWVVHRTIVTRTKRAKYSALKVDAEENLRTKLRSTIVHKVGNSNVIAPYEFITEDQDDRILEMPSATSDFDEIITLLNRAGEDHKVTEAGQLKKAWGYVIKLQVGSEYIYGFTKLGKTWQTKNNSNTFFKDSVLMDLNGETTFQVNQRVDFLAHNGSLFILNKKEFESGMNFREGMERHRDELINEFDTMDLFNDVTILREIVGSNMHRLRKLATVRNSGYFRLPWYIDKIKVLNIELGWGLTLTEDGAIVVEPEKVDLILTLLNNDRLRSPITEETFDVSIKKPIA